MNVNEFDTLDQAALNDMLTVLGGEDISRNASGGIDVTLLGCTVRFILCGDEREVWRRMIAWAGDAWNIVVTCNPAERLPDGTVSPGYVHVPGDDGRQWWRGVWTRGEGMSYSIAPVTSGPRRIPETGIEHTWKSSRCLVTNLWKAEVERNDNYTVREVNAHGN